jgi:hypothetical protein
VKVDNAGAKYVSAADHGIGDECLTSTLQPIDQLTVERVEIGMNELGSLEGRHFGDVF